MPVAPSHDIETIQSIPVEGIPAGDDPPDFAILCHAHPVDAINYNIPEAVAVPSAPPQPLVYVEADGQYRGDSLEVVVPEKAIIGDELRVRIEGMASHSAQIITIPLEAQAGDLLQVSVKTGAVTVVKPPPLETLGTGKAEIELEQNRRVDGGGYEIPNGEYKSVYEDNAYQGAEYRPAEYKSVYEGSEYNIPEYKSVYE